MLIKYGPLLISIYFEGTTAPGSGFSIQRDSACIVCGGLKPVKYSTHAQLLPFVRCTYAIRLIVVPKKKKTCSTSDGSGAHPLANFSLAVTSAVRRTEMYARTGVTPKTMKPLEREKNHLATVGTLDVSE